MTSSECLYPNYDVDLWMRSCEEEVQTPLEGKITGKIPAWLKGTLLRNGSGKVQVGDTKVGHIFDSAALMHRFAIQDGTVTYNCRFVQSNTFKRNQAANRLVVTEFGTKGVPDPCHTIFDRMAATLKPWEALSDNTNISVYPFADDVYAFAEYPFLHRIDKTTLETVEKKNLLFSLFIAHHTSHPHVMPNGDVYNVGISLVKGKGRISHVVIKFPYNKDAGKMFEKAEIVGEMYSRFAIHPAYMHSFGVTENYFVIVEQPLTLSIVNIVWNQIVNNPLAGSLQWCPEYDTHIVLISRETGREVKRYNAGTVFFMHLINSFEQDGKLMVDLCAYNDAKALEGMYTEALQASQSNPDYAEWFRSKAKRIEVSLEEPNMSKCDVRELSPVGCEMPRINYDYNGRPSRYFYGITADIDSKQYGGLVKVDAKTGETLTWYEKGVNASEPIFASAPNAKDEDDGVVLSALLFRERPHAVALLILDARTMREVARAAFDTPSPAPKCLHGWFLPDAKHN